MSFEAVYRASWRPAGGGERGLRLWVVGEGSARLRLEASGRMGGSWLTVVARDGEVLALAPRTGEYVRQTGARGSIAAASGWPVEAEECAGLLLGDLPSRLGLAPRAARGAAADASQAPVDGAGWVEEAQAPAAGQLAGRLYRYHHPGGGRTRPLLQVDEGRRTALEVVYEAWETRDGVQVPSRLRLQSGEGTLELRLESLSALPSAPGAFDVDPPPGFRRLVSPASRRPGGGWADPGEGP